MLLTDAREVAVAGAMLLGCFAVATELSKEGNSSMVEKTRFEVSFPDNVEVLQSIVFGKGGGRNLKLALFLPKDNRDAHPGIVFIHGGGWRGGNPKQFMPQALYLAAQGYVSACIENRLSGKVRKSFPAAVEDVKCAVRWMRASAKRYKIDPNRIAAAGGSAGAHLAAMLGVTDEEDGLEGSGGHGEFSSKVNAVVAFNGVFNLAAEKVHDLDPVVAFLGSKLTEIPDVYEKASPITYVDKTDAPFLLLHGTKDRSLPYEQSVKMKEALEKAGVRAELFTAKNAGHGFFNHPPWYEPTLKRMEEFLDRVFGEAGTQE